MGFKKSIPEKVRGALICAGVTTLVGLMCLAIVPVRYWFERLSYDLPLLIAPSRPMNGLIVVLCDDKSYRDLNQAYGKLWDRSLYAKLLDRLTSDQAKLAVFDIFLADPGPPTQDDRLARAIRQNGHVVLATGYKQYAQLGGGEPIYPLDPFKKAAAALGVTSVTVGGPDADGVFRHIPSGYDNCPSLVWAAAAQAGLPAAQLKTRLQIVRWMNYPSSLKSIKWISFSDALQQQPGFFKNKYVFVGSGWRTKLEGQETDEFATPLGRFGGSPQPGVLLQAVAFLNLIHGNWLEQMPPFAETALVLFLGALVAVALRLLRPWRAAALAAAAMVLVFAASCVVMFHADRWWSWAIVACAETPFAFIWSVTARAGKLARETERVADPSGDRAPVATRDPSLTASEAVTVADPRPTGAAPSPSTAAPPGPLPSTPGGTGASPPTNMAQWMPPSVSDHTLVRCIGRGAYGEVWLAQDVIGSYHAVKFVYRETFQSDEPFNREFKGIERFTPISRIHEGLIHILHVGSNERNRYFFYIMELGDDETSGQQIDPATYTAKTLSRVIHKRGRLPAADCLQLGLQLSSALQFLHENHLIHRDIKPSNVLYVRDKAKFADVGLVTQLHSLRADATYIGTEGYIPPEGPGTAAADIYSLGKVLYEAAMGLDRKRFPDLPTSMLAEQDPLLLRLNPIIVKACEPDPNERYRTVKELHDDLQALQSSTSNLGGG